MSRALAVLAPCVLPVSAFLPQGNLRSQVPATGLESSPVDVQMLGATETPVTTSASTVASGAAIATAIMGLAAAGATVRKSRRPAPRVQMRVTSGGGYETDGKLWLGGQGK